MKNLLLIVFCFVVALPVVAHEKASKSHGVMSLDVKQTGDTVHVLLGKQDETGQSMWYQTSADRGQSWAEPVLIAEKLKAKFKRGNDVRLAVQGENLVAVWMMSVKGNRHNAGPMQAARSTDGGKTWALSASPADWDGLHAFYAMDANEQAISLAWLDSREKIGKGTQGLRYSRSTDGGLSWSENQTLDKMTCACCWNTAMYDNKGDFLVLYRDKKPSDMALGKVSKDSSWERLSTVGKFDWDFAGCPHIGGGLAQDQSGYLHATVGTGHEQHVGVHYQYSKDQGLSWSEPQRLGSDTAVHSAIAVTGNNQIIASWDQLTENGLQIVYAIKPVSEQGWQKEVLVTGDDVSASHPVLIGFESSALLLWTEKDATGKQVLKTQTIELQE